MHTTPFQRVSTRGDLAQALRHACFSETEPRQPPRLLVLDPALLQALPPPVATDETRQAP